MISILTRVLARILDLGRVSNDQGMHMSITLNSQIMILVMLPTTMSVVVPCFATKYKASICSHCTLTLKY